MPLLQTENLTKSFTNGNRSLTVLDGITLAINGGESVAIVGQSGSGKSTLLGLMAGLDRPSAGRIFLGGKDLVNMNEEELAKVRGKQIGFIFQSHRLLPTLTAEENVRVPLELQGDQSAGQKAADWLVKVGLGDRLSHLPAQLSGGEQQRVALARAMTIQPDLLLADEPTGNLDSKTGKEMADLIFSMTQEHGATLVLVTHEAALADRANRVIELRDGKILSEHSQHSH